MPSDDDDVMRLRDVDAEQLRSLLTRIGLKLEIGVSGAAIPGSYWGEDEAGLIGDRLYARDDTPLHSILHETCHFICVDHERRARLNTNAGSDEAEENAVCYLQILLADEIDGFDRQRLFQDMDRWGYSFRMGSSQAWFEADADDALDWLRQHRLIDTGLRPLFKLRSR